MASVPNGVETLPKILVACVGCTNVTDDRQTDGRAMTREFTFAKKVHKYKNRLRLAKVTVINIFYGPRYITETRAYSVYFRQ